MRSMVKKSGTPVSKERINQCFESDLQNVYQTVKSFTQIFMNCQKKAQQIIANMMFNMGRNSAIKI